MNSKMLLWVLFFLFPTLGLAKDPNPSADVCLPHFKDLRETHKPKTKASSPKTPLQKEVEFILNQPRVSDRETELDEIPVILGLSSVEKIAQGGQAIAYRGLTPDGKSTVYKIPLPQNILGDKALVQEFIILRNIHQTSHPGNKYIIGNEILKLHDPDGRLYEGQKKTPPELKEATGDFALGLEDGGISLSQFLKKNKITSQQILQFSQELSKAIEATHNANIVHLDIKPLNLFISTDGNLKLGDFGIAVKKYDYYYGVKMTPSYASPNQIKDTIYDSLPSQRRDPLFVIAATSSRKQALPSDDYHAAALTLEEMLIRWVFGKETHELPLHAIHPILTKIEKDPLTKQEQEFHLYEISKPVSAIYEQELAYKMPLAKLQPKEKKLLKMLSTVAWAKRHYREAEPRSTFSRWKSYSWHLKSDFAELLEKADYISRYPWRSTRSFYSLYQKRMLDHMTPTTAARFIFSDPGCIEAWNKYYFNFSPERRRAILNAAKRLEQVSIPADFLPRHRSTPWILDMSSVTP